MPTAATSFDQLARAAFLEAAHQIARLDQRAYYRANGLTLRYPIAREETAESTVVFNMDYMAAFGPEDRNAMLAGLESAGA